MGRFVDRKRGWGPSRAHWTYGKWFKCGIEWGPAWGDLAPVEWVASKWPYSRRHLERAYWAGIQDRSHQGLDGGCYWVRISKPWLGLLPGRESALRVQAEKAELRVSNDYFFSEWDWCVPGEQVSAPSNFHASEERESGWVGRRRTSAETRTRVRREKSAVSD